MLSPTNKKRFSVSSRQAGQSRRFLAFALLIVWLAGLWLVALNRQNIIDWWRLRDYQAPVPISSLATQDTMTDYGRKIFYVNQPVINDKETFHGKCPDNRGEQTIVLGCYLGGQSGIFLLGVRDPRLKGVVQVTAAHEMLHGAYDRLNAKERATVDAELIDFYKNQLKDTRILTTIEAYKKTEPHDIVNEMHSIFGTEITALPANLEQYYSRYFTNRSQVAGFAAQYQAAFTSRRTAITQYDAQLAALKSQINDAEADLKTKRAAIDAQQSSLVSLRNSDDIAAYNAGVPPFNRLVGAYNQEVEAMQGLIARYNQLVTVRNAVASEQQALTKELSSDTAPITQ